MNPCENYREHPRETVAVHVTNCYQPLRWHFQQHTFREVSILNYYESASFYVASGLLLQPKPMNQQFVIYFVIQSDSLDYSDNSDS